MSLWSWLLLAAFLRPLAELFVLLAGEWWYQARFRTDRTLFDRYVIQVTTVGREQDRVNEIIAEIRSFPMSMPYELWVVVHRLLQGAGP